MIRTMMHALRRLGASVHKLSQVVSEEVPGGRNPVFSQTLPDFTFFEGKRSLQLISMQSGNRAKSNKYSSTPSLVQNPMDCCLVFIYITWL
ncbi:hypothetical protein DKX38_014859 [Salix brachista]|uniref:Uncharacterized protein n=1 Tax=Salix brachista TaxID=2182728 RepID=A0A5N5L5J3_9ROSI|nr:hypothetical protein DKX38_014859 [Salix brachista]